MRSRTRQRRGPAAIRIFLPLALALGGAAGLVISRAAGQGVLAPGAGADEVIRTCNRGAALMEQFKHAQAMEEYSKVTARAPGWAPGFVNLGLASLYAREGEKAKKAFREAIRLDPALPHGHYGLGLVLKNEGQSAEAIAALEKAQALDPEDADILYNLGVLHVRERQAQAAIPLLERARQVDPNSISIRYQLARALLQAGRPAAGEKEMAAYQKLAANPKFALPTGNQYGEAGRYALVITDYTVLGAPSRLAPIDIRFSDATQGSGIDFTHGGPGGEVEGAAAARGDGAGTLAARYGSGVAIGDLDGDGRPDLVFANASADGTARPAIYMNRGDFRFENATAASGIVFAGIGMAAALGDFDNDRDPDLYLTRLGGGALFENKGRGVFRDVTAKSGAAVIGFAVGASWADVDHDGDLDLLVARLPEPGHSAPTRVALLLNRGDGTFKESASVLGFTGPPGGSVGGVFADFDADRDIDAVLSAAGGQDTLLDNRRDAGFNPRGKEVGLAAHGEGRGVAAGDVNGDGLADLIFPAGAGRPIQLYLNVPHGSFSPRTIPKAPGVSSYGAVLFDADNDGDLDLFLTGSSHLFYRNDGSGNFQDATAAVGLASIGVKDGRGAAAADLDGDGDLDLVEAQNGRPPILLKNEGGNRNRWLVVETRGLNSNRDGIGTKVEVQAGALWQRREVQAGSGYLSQSSPWVHFGLGDHGLADFIRLVWPGGVLQAEMDVPAGQRVEQVELDRKGSSCPLLFAWDGGKHRFVTDFLGVGGLGLWMAPGLYGKPDPDEYVKIEPIQLAPRDGAYYLQVIENLEEVTYLDETRLMVLDHPKGMEVYPEERFGGTVNPSHRVFAIEREARIYPLRAQDQNGRDVTDKVLRTDRIYPDEFRLLSLAGYAEMHHVTLEFPEAVSRAQRLILFLYGWVDFEYSSTNYAAHQAGVVLTPPILEMQGDDGSFQPVLQEIGFPAGLPRMMSVDLSPLLPLRSRRIRLRTNMRVYWDEIFLAQPLGEDGMRESVKVSEVALGGAHLHRRGFPREHSPDGRQPKIYDYSILDNTQPFRVMTGDYTRFGRVTELLTRTDDRFVIFGKGEEISLEFPTKGLPQLPKGWVRSFMLYASGYCKDMDIHTAFPETVDPLPFHGMSGYPYPAGESYPDDAEHREYRRTYNTRRLEGH